MSDDEIFLVDELWLEILSFLPSWFIVKKCSLISKQLFRIIKQYSKLDVHVWGKDREDSFVKSEFLDRITSLRFSKCDKVFEIIPKMQQLTKINISNNTIPLDSIKKISEFPQLKELYQLKQLTNLNISATATDIESCGEYIGNLKQLTKLCIQYCGINDNDLKSISTLKQLTFLDISLNRNIISKGISYISEMQQLTYLYHNGCDTIGIKYLSKLSNLTTLGIKKTTIDVERMKSLCSMTHLTSLFIDFSKIEVIAAELLSRMTNLTHLSAKHTDLGNDGVSKSKGSLSFQSVLQKLQVLY